MPLLSMMNSCRKALSMHEICDQNSRRAALCAVRCVYIQVHVCNTYSMDFYWTWLIDLPPACTARDLRNRLLGDRRDDAC